MAFPEGINVDYNPTMQVPPPRPTTLWNLSARLITVGITSENIGKTITKKVLIMYSGGKKKIMQTIRVKHSPGHHINPSGRMSVIQPFWWGKTEVLGVKTTTDPRGTAKKPLGSPFGPPVAPSPDRMPPPCNPCDTGFRIFRNIEFPLTRQPQSDKT